MKDLIEDINLKNGHFFEGVEKLLEIWFAGNESSDLRTIPKSTWEDLLKAVKCEIISYSRNESIDAFVLSESSMFVSKHKWILKTCGTTTPLNCLKPLLNMAKEIGFAEITDLFYSRKNFVRPELQAFPHRGFCEETEFLDELFPEGRSYVLGSLNRECWYLYTFSKYNNPTALRLKGNVCDSEADQTIEILMHNLDNEVMSCFTKKASATAKEATLNTGIHEILPNMTIDDFLFEPCGYSMNGIAKNGEYMTIHITPEKSFSYVSFESNIALDSYAGLIDRVIKTFKPAKFMVTIFANKTSEAYETMKHLNLEYSHLSNWNCMDVQFCNFNSYNLLFAQYSKLNMHC